MCYSLLQHSEVKLTLLRYSFVNMKIMLIVAGILVSFVACSQTGASALSVKTSVAKNILAAVIYYTSIHGNLNDIKDCSKTQIYSFLKCCRVQLYYMLLALMCCRVQLYYMLLALMCCRVQLYCYS